MRQGGEGPEVGDVDVLDLGVDLVGVFGVPGQLAKGGDEGDCCGIAEGACQLRVLLLLRAWCFYHPATMASKLSPWIQHDLSPSSPSFLAESLSIR